MRQRSLDEMITYFNQEIDKMDIDRRYKIALLGMVTAIGCTAKQTIEERKKGRWLRKENKWNLWYECSICGEKAPRNSLGRPWDRSDFCPNCGSYNGGGDDGH